jgi:hypothetical protein
VSSESRHIPFDQLADLAEGRLTPDEQTRLQAHTAICPRCAPQLAWLDRVIGLMRASDYEEPPGNLAGDIASEFDAYIPPATLSLRERIKAVLRFDSALLPLAVGRRSGSSPERQLLFRAETLDLEVRITPADSAWEISGQVLNADVDGLAELHGPAGEARASLNEMGEFLLTPVLAGKYALILRLTTAEIEIPELEIGA